MWKILRVSILSLMLVVVIRAWWQDQQVRHFLKPVTLVIYPVGGSAHLNTDRLDALNAYMIRQAGQYNRRLFQPPFHILLGPAQTEAPPAPPQTGKVTDNILWSLRLR